MTRKHCVAALAALMMMSLPAMAKPDFSGSWKMVTEKSDFGPMPVPEKYEQTIAQSENEIKVNMVQTNAQGEQKAELSYNTDGKETINKFRGAPMKSTAKYEGDNLNIVSKIDFQGNEITINDSWALSDEGKTLVVSRKLATPQGDLEMKIVLSKQ